jgi:hypothetical protein
LATTTTKGVRRRYNRDLATATAAYLGVLIAALTILKAYPDVWWRYPVALAPMVPCVGIVRAILRYLRGADELQRRIELEALAFAFAAGSLVLSYGFLQIVGLPDVSWMAVWPVLAGCWIVGKWLAQRRYVGAAAC